MGVLLGFQGVIGWIMVASGLKAGMTAVEPLDLAAHLLFASLFLVTLVALVTALGENGAFPAKAASPRHAALLSMLILPLVLTQLALGALVAGSHAGLLYNTWPDMDGRFVPPLGELFSVSPWWVNPFENVTLIQFDHRLLAYVACWRLCLPTPSSGGVAREGPRGASLSFLPASSWRRSRSASRRSSTPCRLVSRLLINSSRCSSLVVATRLAVLSRSAKSVSLAVARPLAAHVATR